MEDIIREYDENENLVHYVGGKMMDYLIKKLDDKGNAIYCKYIDGFEQWFEFDEKGREIYYKDSYGESLREYDENGRLSYYIDSFGDEKLFKYHDDKRFTNNYTVIKRHTYNK